MVLMGNRTQSIGSESSGSSKFKPKSRSKSPKSKSKNKSKSSKPKTKTMTKNKTKTKTKTKTTAKSTKAKTQNTAKTKPKTKTNSSKNVVKTTAKSASISDGKTQDKSQTKSKSKTKTRSKSKSRKSMNKSKSSKRTKGRSTLVRCVERKCQRKYHAKLKKIEAVRNDEIPEFKAKGKPPPGQEPKNQFIDPERYTTKMITTFYAVPTKDFKNEQDVAKYNDYEINYEKQLGKGGFGVVYVAKNIKTGSPAAVKIMDLNKDHKFEKRLESIKNELLFMELVDKPYAIRAYCHYVVNKKMYIYMKLADAGCFSKHIKDKKVLGEKESKYFMGQMCAGVENLHSLSIAHRDIKPDNFLMFHHKDKLVLLLCDYGLSCFVHKDHKDKVEMFQNCCGTPAFMAPEILKEKPYNAYQVDIWALGITLYYCLNGCCPFNTKDEDYGLKEMLENKWKFTDKMKEKPSEDLKTLLQGMIQPDVRKRFTMKQCTTSKWLIQDYKTAKELEKELIEDK